MSGTENGEQVTGTLGCGGGEGVQKDGNRMARAYRGQITRVFQAQFQLVPRATPIVFAM